MQKTKSAITVEGKLSSFFENKTGLKQGNYHQCYIIQHDKSDTGYKNGS
jgi:hypothetical protein